MDKEHFKKADLVNLPSCFLDPQGNFIYLFRNYTGVHEELANEIINESFPENFYSDNYSEIRKFGYAYQYLEEVHGYWRYSHWVGEFGVFNGSEELLTFAQKLAIREFCKVNGITWNQVVK